MRQLTNEYPSFSAGHYLLTKKLKDTDDEAFEAHLQKTLVYFYNPLWLQFLLTERKLIDEKEEYNSKAMPDNKAIEMPLPARDLIEDVILHQEPIYGTHDEILDEQTPEFENKVEPVTEQQSLNGLSQPVKIEGDEVLITQTGIIVPEEEAVIPVNSDMINLQSPLIKPQQSIKEEQTIQLEEPLTFQAFHTVDYFASQGIKISQEIQPDDKLGKQLKSFTEWLKTMRRLPAANMEEVLDKTDDEEIEQYAAHSLVEKEVLTEAMAEVLKKQGKYEKAIDVYNKLSLLNPHKRAYFVAKIQDLKQ